MVGYGLDGDRKSPDPRDRGSQLVSWDEWVSGLTGHRHHVCDGIDYRSRPASISSRRGASCEPNSFAFSYQLRADEMSETCVPKTPIFSSMIGS